MSNWWKVQETQWKAVGQQPRKAAALEPAQMGWSYRLCRTVLPKVPPLHWDSVQLPHIRHRQQNLELHRLDWKPQVRLILYLNYIWIFKTDFWGRGTKHENWISNIWLLRTFLYFSHSGFSNTADNPTYGDVLTSLLLWPLVSTSWI